MSEKDQEIKVMAKEQDELDSLLLSDQFNLAPFGMAAIDTNQKIVKANPKFYKIWGASEDDFVGKKIWDIIVPDCENEAINFSEFRDDGGYLYLKDGRTVQIRYAKLDLDGYADRLFFFYDAGVPATLLHQNAELYLANVLTSSADYLNTIKGITTLVESDAQALKTMLDTIKIRTERLEKLINNINQAYRYQKNDPGTKEIPVYHVLQLMHDAFDIRLGAQRLKINYCQPGQSGETGFKDRQYLDRCVCANSYISSMILDNIAEAVIHADPFKDLDHFIPEIYLYVKDKFLFISFSYKGLDEVKARYLFKKRIGNAQDFIRFGLYTARSVAQAYGGELRYEAKPPLLTLRLRLAPES